MMTIPMEVKVPEKPCPMTVGMVSILIPATRARRIDTHMIERNGWMCSFEIAMIMIAIASTKAINKGIPVIFSPPCRQPFCLLRNQAFSSGP